MFRLLLALLLVAFPTGVQAATLRTHTLLRGPDIRLSDLFKDAGPNADRRLGPSPPAGGRIVVEAAQLGAIARQFGVDWQPASSGDRAILERPGRSLPRDKVLAAVKTALQAAGASDHCEVELPAFSPPVVPVDVEPHLDVTQLVYDQQSGRFTAILSVTAAKMDPINLRIAGRAEDTEELPVATARLPVGRVLTEADVHMARVLVSSVHREVVHALADAVGMQLRRAVSPGRPLPRAALMRPALVRRGSAVRIELHAGGLSVAAQGVARQSGAIGERIRVMNTGSGAIIEAVVSGPNTVRAQPNSMPLSFATNPYRGMTR